MYFPSLNSLPYATICYGGLGFLLGNLVKSSPKQIALISAISTFVHHSLFILIKQPYNIQDLKQYRKVSIDFLRTTFITQIIQLLILRRTNLIGKWSFNALAFMAILQVRHSMKEANKEQKFEYKEIPPLLRPFV